MVRQWTDDKFANKAESAFEKIQAVLPSALQGELQQITTYAMPTMPPVPWTISFSDVRECIRAHRKIRIKYSDENKQNTTRTLRPLALFFFNPVWLLASWCEKRDDFRNFRLDRIQSLSLSEETFEDDESKNLAAYMAKDGDCNI